MKRIYLYITIIIVSLLGCEKEPYDRFPDDYSVEDITRLELSSSTKYLFANGTAEVEFFLDAFYTYDKTVKILENNEVKDTTYVDFEQKYRKRNIPEGVEILTADGQKVENLSFSTTDPTPRTLEFYAKAGEMVSDPVTVVVEPVPTESYSEIVIPVVFHMVETDEYTTLMSTFDQEKVAGIIDNLNSIFSNTAKANAPHSIDLNVRFELATLDPQGKVIEEPGINKVQIGDVEDDEAYAYLKDNLIWDHNSYLNIWICYWHPMAYRYPPEAYAPTHITTDPAILPGLDMVQIADGDPIEVTEPTDIGIIFTPEQFNEEYQIASAFGTFFGLLPTSWYVPFIPWEAPLVIVDGDVDYCPDSYTYIRGPRSIYKTTYLDEKFMKSINIMDDYTIGSVVSYHQGQRIRNVLEYCPLRQWNN